MKHAVRGAALALLLGLAAPFAAAAPDNPPPPPKEVSGPEMSMLIRTTMVALHQANVTGNYTVLRDLGAGILRASNTASDLAVLFAPFREKQFNLAPSVLMDAVLDEKPKLTTNGEMRLTGHFPTKPQEIMFDMTFLYEGGAWRIALIQVGSRMAVASKDEGKPAAKPRADAEKTAEQAPPPKPKPKPKAKPDPSAAMELVPPAK